MSWKLKNITSCFNHNGQTCEVVCCEGGHYDRGTASKVKNVTGCRSNIVAIFFVVIVIEDSKKGSIKCVAPIRELDLPIQCSTAYVLIDYSIAPFCPTDS